MIIFSGRATFALLAFILFAATASRGVHAEDISKLAGAPPVFQGAALPSSSYVTVDTQRFAHARVVWLNFDWLREHGIDYPANWLTPEFEEKVLSTFAYGVPGKGQDPTLFTGEHRTFYADRYGGEGIGFNFGSGRAASSGRVQVKGLGVTSLVGSLTSFDHAHGGASLDESIREAIWGEVNQHELPFGSNRVIAIIDTGANTEWQDGSKEKRALIVREDPLRPAHFMSALYGHGPWEDSDLARTQAAVANADYAFAKLLPDAPAEGPTAGGSALTGNGFREYVKRVALQYAATYARRIYHGATSQSNIDLRGHFLDFGTETALPGYQPVQVLRHIEPFGELGQIKKYLVIDLRASLEQNAGSAAQAKSLPSAKQAIQLFDEYYQQALRFEMLRLTGAPPELLPHVASMPVAQSLADTLIEAAKSEHPPARAIVMDQTIPAEVRSTQLGSALTALAKGDVSALEPMEIPLELKQRLIRAYSDFTLALKGDATQNGIPAQALQTYMELAAERINRPMDSLLRPRMLEKDREMVSQFTGGGDRSVIWAEINRQIENNRRTYRDAAPYELVLDEKIDHLTGNVERRAFDLRTGAYRDETLTPATLQSYLNTVATENPVPPQAAPAKRDSVCPPRGVAAFLRRALRAAP